MSSENIIDAVQKLKKTHENIAVGVGVSIGLILFGYFFSFAAFVDHLKSGLVIFQTISTILFVLCLIFLKKVSFFLTKLKYGKKEPYYSVLKTLNHQDFEKDAEAISALVNQRSTQS